MIPYRTCLYLIMLALFAFCNPPVVVNQKLPKHLAELRKPGSMLYVDIVPNKMVLQEKEGDGKSHSIFKSYLVGFYDSTLITDAKQDIEKGKYFEYEMSGNWKTVINGDSLSPVFFQVVQKLNKNNKEGVLVFEVPRGRETDTLIYQDGFDSWGQQVIIINKSK